MIKMNKTFPARPRTSGPGPTRRLPNRSASRAAPYSFSTILMLKFGILFSVSSTGDSVGPRHVRGGGGVSYSRGARVSAIETGTRLLISNLHYGVSEDDIEELFSGVGDLKSCSVHYDRSGRSEGTAEVVFSRRRDAEAAIKRYDNVQLDGNPMKIEIVGMSMALPPVLPPASRGRHHILKNILYVHPLMRFLWNVIVTFGVLGYN
ncbi:hypothetical protein Pfo_028867 [Paulownia fortunei]|nr:hypothetical protein Pfo_028867 [Paulownia fortunei]